MNTTPKHWAYQYIGKPWVSGARGPDQFDCWGFVYWVCKTHLGIEIPEYAGTEVDAEDPLCVARALREIGRSAGSHNWVPVQIPTQDCTVAMGGVEQYTHVGIYVNIDGGLILHCSRQGVVATSERALRTHGFQHIVYFQHQ